MSFTAWIKGRVIPINSVLGLREILDNLVEDAINEGSTTTAPSQDAVYQEIDSINSALALKADKAITFVTVANLTLTKSSFGSSVGVYDETDANAAMTLNVDLRDGIQRIVTVKNTALSGTIAVTIPTPRGGLATATIPFGWFCDIIFFWNGTYMDVVHRIYEVAL